MYSDNDQFGENVEVVNMNVSGEEPLINLHNYEDDKLSFNSGKFNANENEDINGDEEVIAVDNMEGT